MARPRIMFVNLRRTGLEVRQAFYAARRAGYDVVLLADMVPELPDGIVCEVEQANTFDLDHALAAATRLARRAQVAGVVTWSDRDVELTASIARALGLPGLTEPAARRARDKYLMREALRDEPDLIPAYALVRSMRELREAAEKVGYPAILKPTGAAGSIGVFSIDSENDLAPAFDRLYEITNSAKTPMLGRQSRQLIYEERLDGSQHSVEGVVWNGEVLIAGVTDHLSTPPYHPDVQEVHPSRLEPGQQNTVRRLCRRVIGRLGLDWTAFHLECKLQPSGAAKLIEVAARVPGAHIGSHLIPLSTGVPFYENVIRVACGETPNIEPQPSLIAGSRALFAPRDGTLKGMAGLQDILAIPAVQHVAWEQRLEAEVRRPPADFVSWVVASVIALGATHDEVDDALSRADAASRIEVSPTAQANGGGRKQEPQGAPAATGSDLPDFEGEDG